MSTSDSVFSTLTYLLAETPIILIWLAGIVVALLRWQRHPRVSLLTLIALIIFLFNLIIGGILNVQIPLMLSEGGLSMASMGTIFLIKSVIQALLATIGYGLLLFALFGWRTAAN